MNVVLGNRGSPQASQLAFTVYNDLVYLQITTKNHRSYPEYFRKARELVWAAIRASFLLGTELEGIAYSKKADTAMIEKFKIDSKKIDCNKVLLDIVNKILGRYLETYNQHSN